KALRYDFAGIAIGACHQCHFTRQIQFHLQVFPKHIDKLHPNLSSDFLNAL
ncbi:MAG: hypothetical protein ACI9GB_003875, partial [Halioglobus sp.]